MTHAGLNELLLTIGEGYIFTSNAIFKTTTCVNPHITTSLYHCIGGHANISGLLIGANEGVTQYPRRHSITCSRIEIWIGSISSLLNWRVIINITIRVTIIIVLMHI